MEPESELDASTLALMTPRFRGIAVKLASVPFGRRRALMDEWLAGQPDADVLRAALAAADPFAMLPGQNKPGIN